MSKLEGVVYRHAVEAFVQHIIARHRLLTPEFAKEMLALGIDLHKPRDAQADAWVALLRATASRLSPGAPEAEAMERIGHEMLRGLFETLIGKGMLMVMKLLGPKRALLRIAESYRMSDNITQVTTTDMGPTHVRLSFNTVGGCQTYVRGLLLEAMATLNVRPGEITFIDRADGGTDYDVKWLPGGLHK